MGANPDLLNKVYPAKVILFGEYTVLLRSSILSLPIPNFIGQWKKLGEHKRSFNPAFLTYLKNHASSFLDIKLLDKIVEQGYYFNSNIPQSAGLGSSGALSAAIYDLLRKKPDSSYSVIQEELGIIESFFHGRSSGFDPLVSLLNRSILKDENGQIHLIDDVAKKLNKFFVYLLDSRVDRGRKDLITSFMSMADRQPGEFKRITEVNNKIIRALLSEDDHLMMNLLRELSLLQWKWMHPMITEGVKAYWLDGLDSGEYFAKICGTGGGGYYLLWSLKPVDWVDNKYLIPISFDNSCNSSGQESH